MDQLTEDDCSSMMDSVEVPTSELNCVNSVANVPDTKDTVHETPHVAICAVTDQCMGVCSEQITFSENDPPMFDKPLHGSEQDPALLTVNRLEDYSDVSSCSETDFGQTSDLLEKGPEQSSECQDNASSRDETKLEEDAGKPNTSTSYNQATQEEDYVCRASNTEGDEHGGGFNVKDGENVKERSLTLTTAEGDGGCPLKSEEQVKEGILIQNTDCRVTEKSESGKDNAITPNSVWDLDLKGPKQGIKDNEKNVNSTGNVDVQNEPHVEAKNDACDTESKSSEYGFKHDVENAAPDNEPKNDETSQSVEHSSFEFLQSCLNSLDHTKLHQDAANNSTSASMTSQNCNVDHSQPAVLATPALESLPTDQLKAATDNCLQEPCGTSIDRSTLVSPEPGQQNDSLEEQVFDGLASTEGTYDNGIKTSPSLLSSKKLMKNLQPVVLLNTTKSYAEDGNLYGCSICLKSTQSLDDLIEHHHCKHSKHSFQYCLTCEAYFCNETLATGHSCEQIGPKDMLLAGVILSTNKQTTEENTKYLCRYCLKPFIKIFFLQNHEERHTSVTDYRCNCCGLYFPTYKKLISHRGRVRCNPLVLEPDEQSKTYSEREPNPAKPPTTLGGDGSHKLHNCFVKLVDIKETTQCPQNVNCPVCGKGFKLRAQLKLHLRSHTDAKPFKCNQCNQAFKYSWNLEKHKELCSGNITKQHLSKPSFEYKLFSRYPCPTCPQTFKYSYNRTRHMRERCLKAYLQMQKGKVGNRHKCPLCSETFGMACTLNRHIKNTCFEQYKLQRNTIKDTLVMQNIKVKKEEKPVLPTEKSCYKCKICPASYLHKSGVYRHMRKHSFFERSSVQGVKSEKTAADEVTVSNNKKPQSQEPLSQKSPDMVTSDSFLCHFCDKCFSSDDLLSKHLQQHGGAKPFVCLECGKIFARRGHLISHRNIHRRRVQCSVCKKIVPTIGDLLKHRQSHTKKGILQCPDCPMQFRFPVYFLRHVATHAKKEPLPISPAPPADIPLKEAADKKVTFNGSFCCGICRKTFVDSKTMSQHCLIHIPKPTDSKCPVCRHSFTTRIGLIRHIRLHTGERPFACNICGITFHRKERLKLHQEKCKGLEEVELAQTPTLAETRGKCEVKAASNPRRVRQIECSYCPRTFSKSSYLKLHVKAHLANSLEKCKKCGKCYKRSKISEHRNVCNTKEESYGEPSKSEESGNACKDECKGTNVVVANRACRILKETGSNVKDSLKERCPHCSMRFQYRSYLLRHISTHLVKKQFACKNCGQKYANRSTCQQHEAECHGVLRQHETNQPNESEGAQTIPNSAASNKKHTVIIGENGDQLKCSFCTKTFTKPRNLRRHILTHTDVKPYSCKTCPSCFSRHDHLKRHQARCRGKKQLEVQLKRIALDQVGSKDHPQPQCDSLDRNTLSETFSATSNLSSPISMPPSTVKPFSCKACGNSYTTRDSLKRHHLRGSCKMPSTVCLEEMQMPTEFKTSVQACGESSKLLQYNEGNYSNKWKFSCEYCPRRFKNPSELTLHTRLHTGERPFVCGKCDEGFIRKDYLKRHLTKCSGKRGPKVLCDRCGGLFTQEALEVHQNNCIISLKSTDCPGPADSISSSSKVKAFSCVHCDNRFLLFSQLQQHVLTNHRSVRQQQSNTPKYESLNNMQIKEEPVDDQYDESSHQKNANNEHKNVERPKPFKCEQCNTRFITNSGLAMHLRTHTASYTLYCKKCNKGFWNKAGQQKHTRRCKGLEVTTKEPNQKGAIPSESTNDDILVFRNKDSNATGTGVLQTKFSCKDQDKGPVVHKYQCSECEESFTDGLMLISHLEAHGREDQERISFKSHRCYICSRSFKQSYMLKMHLKTHHQEAVRNTCPECFKSFRCLSDLDIHRSCHDPNRPFVCKICELRFWTPKSLNAHQRLSHSSVEPRKTIVPCLKTDQVSPKVYTCQPCNKIYTIRRSYMKHIRAKHNGSAKSLDDLKSAPTEHQLSNNESSRSNADDKAVGEDDRGEDDHGEDDDDEDDGDAPYFPCHVCGKTFLTSENLEDHQRCHLGEKPYECEECGKCFIQLVNLQQHQRSHKSEFQCQMCGKGFVSLFALRKHKHTHVGKHPHRCTKCQLSFTRSSKLREHMTTHREENFPCDLCHENFSCKSSRAEHRKIHTEGEDELPPLIPPAKQASSPPVSVSPSLSTAQQYRYRCEICQVRFPDPEQLSEHGCNPAKERPYSCKDCNQHFLHGSHLKKHQLTHQLSGSRSFQCNSCHMSFRHRHHFLTHLQTHGGENSSKTPTDKVKKLNTDDSNQDKIYRCPICPESFSEVLELANHLSVHAYVCIACNETFSTKQQLEKHQQCHLSAATHYECTECGKSFLGSEAFRQHYCVHQEHRSKRRRLENSSDVLANINAEEEEEVDVGEDFYNCTTCNKRFPSNLSLQEHQKLHAIGRPFKCSICGKSFAQKRYLAQHQRVHNDHVYQCDLCSSSFKTEQLLLSHRKSHMALPKYHCSVCSQSFKTPYDLSKHEQKHPELQTFSEVSGDHRCDMCYKSFSLLSQLRQHQETHVGQVVYECTECDKAFAFPHLLEEHQQTHGTSSDSYQSQSPSDILFQSPVME
ncbi:zinc finger protein 1035 [Silurus meridionalis]|uniref:zinc finger protein 1035 n=1 Tax=Silurus meridionalis TaxID=175797 RepID=UPI001EEB073D|nr:zinc finger protein 1035 [Silurus meridionalis]XP_046703090.1 zinc finger protein 1035 [Silurus meridionalis]